MAQTKNLADIFTALLNSFHIEKRLKINVLLMNVTFSYSKSKTICF